MSRIRRPACSDPRRGVVGSVTWSGCCSMAHRTVGRPFPQRPLLIDCAVWTRVSSSPIAREPVPILSVKVAAKPTGPWSPRSRAGNPSRGRRDRPRTLMGDSPDQPRLKPTTRSSWSSASVGSMTLMVVMPMAAAGLRFTPRSSRKTASCGSTPARLQAIS